MADAADVKLQITYRAVDFYKAAFIHSARRLGFWTPAIGALVGILIIAGAHYRRSGYLEPSLALFGVVLAAAVGLAISVLLVLYQTKSVTKYPGMLSPITLLFSNSGIASELANEDSRTNWTLVTGALESTEFIFIGMRRGTYFLVPKLQLTADQIARLKDILRQHVSKNLKLRP